MSLSLLWAHNVTIDLKLLKYLDNLNAQNVSSRNKMEHEVGVVTTGHHKREAKH